MEKQKELFIVGTERLCHGCSRCGSGFPAVRSPSLRGIYEELIDSIQKARPQAF